MADRLPPGDGSRAPRVLIPSLRRLRVLPVFSAVFEFEDVVAEVSDATIAEMDFRGSRSSHLAAWSERVVRHLGHRPVPMPFYRPIEVEGHYDVMFQYVVGLSEIDCLDGLKGWRKHCDQAVLFIWELWPAAIETFRAYYAALDQFDHIYVGTQLVAEQLSKRIGREVRWLAPATDITLFAPVRRLDRPIDVFSLGRRGDLQHSETLRLRQEHDWFYVFESAWTANFDDHRDHRAMVAENLQRSKFYVANRGKFNHDTETRGVHDFGNRFFDGTAAGSIIVGEFPKTSGFDSCFSWGEIGLDIMHTDETFGDQLLKHAADSDWMQEVSRRNAVESARRHDWAHRWQRVLDDIGVAGGPKLDERLVSLENTAQLLERP